MGRGDITGKLSKSKTKGAVISFDEDARKTFLTGFRKRKNDRRQYARQKIAEQVRQEKLTARQERREAQKEALAGADSDGSDSDGSDAEPEGAEVSTYASGDALVTTVVEALLPDEDEKEEEDEKLGRVGGPSYTAPKKIKKFNLSQPLSQAVPGYKPKARACTGLALCTPLHLPHPPHPPPRFTLRTIRRCWRAVARRARRQRRRRRTRSSPRARRPGGAIRAGRELSQDPRGCDSVSTNLSCLLGFV
jgi:hypothetical protein